jgi:hypothetical protein
MRLPVAADPTLSLAYEMSNADRATEIPPQTLPHALIVQWSHQFKTGPAIFPLLAFPRSMSRY